MAVIQGRSVSSSAVAHSVEAAGILARRRKALRGLGFYPHEIAAAVKIGRTNPMRKMAEQTQPEFGQRNQTKKRQNEPNADAKFVFGVRPNRVLGGL